MRGYSDITRATSMCVHFVQRVQSEEDRAELLQELEATNIKCVYIDCRELAPAFVDICDAIGIGAEAEHAPYREVNWVRLLDDLISLSSRLPGIAIILDGAQEIFNDSPSIGYELIEAFLIQFHHWFNKKKPCHLYFQLVDDPAIAEIFA